MTSVRGVVVVAHGGQEIGEAPTSALQPAVLRMIPLAAAISRAVHKGGVLVRRPRFRVRGWNGAQASPVQDLTDMLDAIDAELGPVPVVLVGHSMGGRAAMGAAGHRLVSAVAGLAPWLPPGEPVAQLAGRRIMVAHGTMDFITRADETWAFADRARAVTTVAEIQVRGGDHAMIRRASLWHALAATFACVSLGLAPPPGPLADALSSPERTAV